MGYYTLFTLEVVSEKPADFKPLCDKLASMYDNNYLIGYAFESEPYISDDGKICTFYPHEMVKWYDYAKDMAAVSEMFPDFVFRVHGDGEETNDYWHEYFYRGKSAYTPVKISYKDPDPDIIPWYKFGGKSYDEI